MMLTSKNNENLSIDFDHEKCIIFIRFKLFMAHFIRDKIFQTSTGKTR